TRTVWATEGDVAQLPCNLTSPLPSDPALLVLWYKDGISKPIYSYDMRNGAATHWRNPSHFGSRAAFDTAFLKIQRIHAGDEGTYRCRVDFRTNPTLTFTTNLTVIVPPKRLAIYTDVGVMARSVVGPFTEGSVLRLTCRATGGSPTPTVTWWEGASLLDLTSEVQEVDEISNLLVVPALTRNDLHRAFTCQAANSNLTAPLLATVTLDMHFPPLWVRFLSNRDALSAGWPYSVVCQSAGARPPAVITWRLGTTRFTTHTEKTSDDGNVTTSELRWTPSAADEGKILSCQAESPALTAQPLVDEWPLNIFYVPVTTLQPGRSVNLSKIEEGDDVYFECSIKANPPVYKIIWLHETKLNDKTVTDFGQKSQPLASPITGHEDSGAGVTAIPGYRGSSPLLTVSPPADAPVCRSNHMVYHGAARYEQVNIPCDLDAYPTPMAFRWTFNNSGESVEIPQEHILVAGSRSTVSYTPNTELDYGTLLCWGINTVGQQHHPCVFHVFPAGHPDPVNNCSVYNLSVSVIHVRCVAGFDGGLPQTFMLELYEQAHDRLLANASSPVPIFSVSGLPPGMTFTGVVYSYNSKGRGEKVSLHVYTIKDLAEKRTGWIARQQPCSAEDTQYTELLLSGAGASSTSSTAIPTQHHDPHRPTTTPTQPHDPHRLVHVALDDSHGHSHYPPPHQYPAYPLPSSATATPTHNALHQCTPSSRRHPQTGGQQGAPWTPSPVSIGRRHSLRRDPHPCDPEATVPLMTNQKESSV
ncbi:kin of IRRE-like protein 2, partial [Panulirus ornatus]|uniref:kin of IRRE-like protein 2 n=1 Tax=Panulirus ornatus TaxID=150431 RepID=UPI003A89E6B5